MTDSDEIQATRAVRRRMTRLLLGWSIASVVVAPAIYWIGTTQESTSKKFAEAVASQFFIWGLIDLVFATLGVVQSRRFGAVPVNPQAIAEERQAVEKLCNSLRFNRTLNWLWVSSGIVLLAAAVGAVFRSSSAEAVGSLFGHAAGVLIQACFLFWFDRRFLSMLNAASTAGR